MDNAIVRSDDRWNPRPMPTFPQPTWPNDDPTCPIPTFPTFPEYEI